MTDRSQLEEIKANVRSLIQSQSNSFYTILELQKDYKDVMGHEMPLLGHRNAEHFLRDMPDVVKITGYGPQAHLQYIPTQKSKHIGELIKNQRQNTGKRRPRHTRTRNYYRPNKAVPFPQYSDESDYESRDTIAKIEAQQPVTQCDKKVNINTSLNNASPAATQCSEITFSSEEPKKNKTSRTEFLIWMRKKYAQQENSATQSASSTHSSDSTADSNDNPTQTTAYRGYKHILDKIKNNEAASATEPQLAGSRLKQLLCRTRPELSMHTKFHQNDQEEAVPAHAVTDLIERMNSTHITNVPSGPCLSEISIPQFNIHEKFKIGEILSLIVGEIDSPLLFYFHLFEELHDFRNFQQEFQCTYSALARGELCMSEYNLHIGMVCAAYFNERWHRAIICAVPQDPNEFTQIKLFLVDRGLYCDLAIRHLKFLARRFSYLPAQAIYARLANIKPQPYSRESPASIVFQKWVREKHLYGYINCIGSNTQQIELILLDTNVEPKRRIDVELIKAGLVEEA